MELGTLDIKNIQAMAVDQLKEAEVAVRREIAMMRLQVFKENQKNKAKKKQLKKSLARVLTVRRANILGQGV